MSALSSVPVVLWKEERKRGTQLDEMPLYTTRRRWDPLQIPGLRHQTVLVIKRMNPKDGTYLLAKLSFSVHWTCRLPYKVKRKD